MDMHNGTIHISAYISNQQKLNDSTLQPRLSQSDIPSANDPSQQIRYRGKIYNKEALQNRLQQEVTMLMSQLKNCSEGDEKNNSIVMDTYEEMIRRRQKEYEAILLG